MPSDARDQPSIVGDTAEPAGVDALVLSHPEWEAGVQADSRSGGVVCEVACEVVCEVVCEVDLDALATTSGLSRSGSAPRGVRGG